MHLYSSVIHLQKNGILDAQTNGKNNWITKLHAEANTVYLLSQTGAKISQGLDIVRRKDHIV